MKRLSYIEEARCLKVKAIMIWEDEGANLAKGEAVRSGKILFGKFHVKENWKKTRYFGYHSRVV